MSCMVRSQVSQPHLTSTSHHQSKKLTSQKYNELATSRTNVSNVWAQVHLIGSELKKNQAISMPRYLEMNAESVRKGYDFDITSVLVSVCIPSSIDLLRLSELWLHAGRKQSVEIKRGGTHWPKCRYPLSGDPLDTLEAHGFLSRNPGHLFLCKSSIISIFRFIELLTRLETHSKTTIYSRYKGYMKC